MRQFAGLVLFVCMAILIMSMAKRDVSQEITMQTPTPEEEVVMQITPTRMATPTIAWQSLPTENVTFLVVTVDHLNLRDGPGMDYAVLDWLDRGNKLIWLHRCKDGWAQVSMQDGWVFAKYIEPNLCR